VDRGQDPKVKPGKGGAYNQVELKNATTGTKLNQLA
jgi:translation elongation factor P/translation initiation factor 5A